MIYEKVDEDVQIVEFTRYEKGCVSFVQSFDDIFGNRDFSHFVNHV